MGKEKISFEEAMSRLEEIANELEKDNLSLDESTKKFEEGMELSKKCAKMLDETEKKITMLINSDGETKEQNFTPEE